MTTVTMQILHSRFYFGLPLINMIEKMQEQTGVLEIRRSSPLVFNIKCRGKRAVKRLLHNVSHEMRVLNIVVHVPQRGKHKMI